MRQEPRAMDQVFRALADPTRRVLLDRLREANGQTLSGLCDDLGMTRQSATQHLDVLAGANLVVVVRRGRERLHYLNPVPIHEIRERWISEFDAPRLSIIHSIKQRAEEIPMSTESTTVPTYVYVTYIHASPERVWEALTDADLSARYWGHASVSDWKPGSPWELKRVDGSGAVSVVGNVVETDPPRRLAFTFDDMPEQAGSREPSLVTVDIEPHEEIVRLTVTHERLANDGMYGGISRGWPAVLSNLKSLLETGDVLPQSPWEMFSVGA